MLNGGYIYIYFLAESLLKIFEFDFYLLSEHIQFCWQSIHLQFQILDCADRPREFMHWEL